MDRDFGRLGATTTERAYAGESIQSDRQRSALDEVENQIINAVSSAEVILCGLESLADRIYGSRPENVTASGANGSEPSSALGHLHKLTERLHDRLNRLDAVKNRLIDLA